MKKILLSAFALIGLAFAAIADHIPHPGAAWVIVEAPVPDVPNWRIAAVDLIHLVPDHALSGGDGRPI